MITLLFPLLTLWSTNPLSLRIGYGVVLFYVQRRETFDLLLTAASFINIDAAVLFFRGYIYILFDA